jgi:hypothetical protein
MSSWAGRRDEYHVARADLLRRQVADLGAALALEDHIALSGISHAVPARGHAGGTRARSA